MSDKNVKFSILSENFYLKQKLRNRYLLKL